MRKVQLSRIAKQISGRPEFIPEKFVFRKSGLSDEYKEVGTEILGKLWHCRSYETFSPYSEKETFILFRNEIAGALEASSCIVPGKPTLLTRNSELLQFLDKEKKAIKLCGFDCLIKVQNIDDKIRGTNKHPESR